MGRSCFSHVDWIQQGVGTKPDSIVAEQVGCSRSLVSKRRRELGIPAFVGLTLNQEGQPLRSTYEAKYDAWLHWKGIEHEHDVPVPELGVVADFHAATLGWIEVAGMRGYDRYDRRFKEKKRLYAEARIPVTWLSRSDVDALFKDCPVPLKFRERKCPECRTLAHSMANGMCRPCARKKWGEDRAARRVCEQCGQEYLSAGGQDKQRFCSHDCYSKSLAVVDWPSWDEIEARLAEVSVPELARELGVRPGTLHVRLQRRGTDTPRVSGRESLTEDDVRLIRKLYATGEHSQASLARQFGVKKVALHNIVKRKSWRHVE